MGETVRSLGSGRKLAGLFAVLGLVLVACGDGDESAGEQPNGDQADQADQATEERVTGVTGACPDRGSATIGLATPIPIDLFETYKQVVTTQAEEAGHEVVTVTGPLPPNPGQQVSDVNSLIDRGIDVLIVAPIIPQAMQPVVGRANAEGIPVVGIDIAEELMDQYVTTITSDNFEGARLAALHMAELVGEGGSVAIMNGPEFVGRPLVERAEGFAAGAQEAGLDVVDTEIDPTISPEGGGRIANGWKQQYPDLEGVLVYGDPAGLGVQSAVDGSWDPVVMSMNGEVAAIEAVATGSLAATYDLVPVVHGYALAYAAEQAFCGEELPSELKIDIVQVDESNVESWVPLDEQQESAFAFRLEDRDGTSFVELPAGFPFADSS
jgi:ABC-type sugar transport system substrate-binding protein